MHTIPRTALALSLAAVTATAEPLPSLTFIPGTTTVSGLSSGGFMTVQIQVAFSQRIAGAGVVAGGPYDCADDLLWRALYVCMDPIFVTASTERSVDAMRAFAEAGEIDPITGLVGDRIYLFHGQADDTVARTTMDALHDSYVMVGVDPDDIDYVTRVNAGHGFVTEAGPVACAVTRPDFLIDCDFDQAAAILRQLYGPLADAVAPVEAQFLRFDQALYADGVPGMDDTGFAYVPAACAAGTACRLHIALHGCKQGREVIGEDYARLTGYNAWAEANEIVVLYPQAKSIPASLFSWFPDNPNGCWDWWGYADDDYMTRDAPQIAAIARMAAALGAPLAE